MRCHRGRADQPLATRPSNAGCTNSKPGLRTANAFAIALKGALVWCTGLYKWRAVPIKGWRVLSGGLDGASSLPTWSCWRATGTNGGAVINSEEIVFSDKS